MTDRGHRRLEYALILVGILVPTLLWADLTNRNILIVILSTLAFGAIGQFP